MSISSVSSVHTSDLSDSGAEDHDSKAHYKSMETKTKKRSASLSFDMAEMSGCRHVKKPLTEVKEKLSRQSTVTITFGDMYS